MMHSHNIYKNTWFELFALVLILILAAYLRLANLIDNPGWYNDEGTLLNIAHNILAGQFQYFSINQSILLAARLPLFPLLLAGLIKLFGDGIGTLRLFTGCLGVFSAGLLYAVVRRIFGRDGAPLALLSGLMMAIYPQAVLYSRMGFSYNLLTPLVLLVWLGLAEYLRSGKSAWLGMAVLSLGIGAVSDLASLAFTLPFILVVSTRRFRDLAWSLLILLLPIGIYAAFMLFTEPETFRFDLLFLLDRLSIPVMMQFPLVALNYAALMIWDAWMAPAMIGLLVLRPVRWRRLSLLFFLSPLIILGRSVGLAGFGIYYLIPLFPFVALGMASLLIHGAPLVLNMTRDGLEDLFQSWRFQPVRNSGKWLQKRIFGFVGGVSIFLVLTAPFLTSTLLITYQVRDGFRNSIESVSIDPGDAREVIALVNKVSGPDDLIIASPAIAWAFQAHTTDFQLALAAEGNKTEHFPADIPRDRFAFDARFDTASFVVIDRIWRNWAILAMPELSDKIRQVESWPIIMKRGEFEIYRNPYKSLKFDKLNKMRAVLDSNLTKNFVQSGGGR